MEGDKKITLPSCIQKSLEELLRDLDIKNYTLRVVAGCGIGDNYLGIIARVKVLTEESVPVLRFIIKYFNDGDGSRNVPYIDQVYQAEINAYERFFPEMIRLQVESGIEKIFNPFINVYKTGIVSKNEFLIMADKNAEGFMMRNKSEVIDRNHCVLTMKAYGKYHALSFALKEKKPDVWKLLQNTRDKLFTRDKSEYIYQYLKKVVDKVIKHIDPVKEAVYIHKLEKFMECDIKDIEEYLSAAAVEEFAVFCHGDSWSNNFLYKYEDEKDPSRPTSICILDWQLSKCASPAIDLSYFIFASTDKEMRQNNLDDLLEIYLSSMRSFLDQLGCDSSSFTFDDLKEQMRKFSKYGLMMTMFVVPIMLTEKDEFMELTKGNNMEHNGSIFTGERRKEKIVMERLVDVVRDFDHLGYFDF